MQVLTQGHKYQLDDFEGGIGQTLQFIEKVTAKEYNERFGEQKELLSVDTGGLTTVNNGTTNEEVLQVLIDRMKYLNDKFPCRENSLVITKLEESLMWLEKRTKDRQKRNVEGKALA